MVDEAMIREARAADYEALCALWEEVDGLHREGLPHIFRRPEGPVRDKEYALALMSREDCGFFVAEADGRVVGMVQVMEQASRDIPILVSRRYAEVADLVVSERYRRRGVGRALLDRADRWALDRGLREIELTVYAFNDGAAEFYRGLGYEPLRTALSKWLE